MSIFQKVKVKKPKLTKFNLSHEKKMTGNMGYLYPMLVQEIMPGDSFKTSSEILVRMSPMMAPIMHRLNIKTEYFFVPNRILWDEWEEFISPSGDGKQTPPIFPQIKVGPTSADLNTAGSLPDYLGIPPSEGNLMDGEVFLSDLPFRAYKKIYNEYYRDQNLQEPLQEFTSGGSRNMSTTTDDIFCQKRAWEKDYFTSALPWPQRGEPVDISEITTIEDFREANVVQGWLEKSARTGSRYVEQLLAHFGRAPKDARLQRPEFLGGGTSPMQISEVLGTATTEIEEGEGSQLYSLGEMGGHGISYGNHGFKRSFDEHGYVIGIMSVMPKTAYQDGIHRHWSRANKFDFPWPSFANLGEQEIHNQELYMDYDDVNSRKQTWGYQERYAEFKYAPSTVHGLFRAPYDHWHLGRRFTDLPPLNEDFVKADPSKRIFANLNPLDHELFIQVVHKISALRPLPYKSIPSLGR